MRMSEDEAFVRRNELKKRFKRYGVSFESKKESEKLVERLHREDALVNRRRVLNY